MKQLFALLFALPLAVGCSTPRARTTPVEAVPAAARAVLKELQNGDRACYVILTTDNGEQSIEGDFELCPGASRDASALIGKAVSYRTEKANVLAESCQGDVDCGKSDQVDMIVELTAAP